MRVRHTHSHTLLTWAQDVQYPYCDLLHVSVRMFDLLSGEDAKCNSSYFTSQVFRKLCVCVYSKWPIQLHCTCMHVHTRYLCVSVCVWGVSFDEGRCVGLCGGGDWITCIKCRAEIRELRAEPSWLVLLQYCCGCNTLTHTHAREGETRSAWHSVKFLSPARSRQALRRILHYTHRGVLLYCTILEGWGRAVHTHTYTHCNFISKMNTCTECRGTY